MEDDHPTDPALESREPALADVVELCRQLNQRGAKYLVIGGFAMRAAGFDRRTMDIDLLVETGVQSKPASLRQKSNLSVPLGAASRALIGT